MNSLVSEILDPQKVTLVCGKHNHVAGGVRRHTGCSRCIMVDFVAMFAKTPPEKRQEALDQFEALVHAMCEADDEGTFDINIYKHPTVVIEKDAA